MKNLLAILIFAIICAIVGVILAIPAALLWSAVGYVVTLVASLAIEQVSVVSFWVIFKAIWFFLGLVGGTLGFVVGAIGGFAYSD